ncbi:unnamed protein product [Nippostrongylus brasiliensis]|uniref:Uncharacterized protein n=1 Tax=Nippostrongylus brasiliensis TaxID=27835 RepID=A0A0N4XUQ1_NIPBR|nr:unnamed protein product [Nippostrongylus brasiliensis]
MNMKRNEEDKGESAPDREQQHNDDESGPREQQLINPRSTRSAAPAHCAGGVDGGRGAQSDDTQESVIIASSSAIGYHCPTFAKHPLNPHQIALRR